jgi:hypothetical protein
VHLIGCGLRAARGNESENVEWAPLGEAVRAATLRIKE